MRWLVMLALLTGCESEYAKWCRKNGGHLVEVNCRTESEIILMPNANGGMDMYPSTTTRCNEHCVGTRAEGN